MISIAMLALSAPMHPVDNQLEAPAKKVEKTSVKSVVSLQGTTPYTESDGMTCASASLIALEDNQEELDCTLECIAYAYIHQYAGNYCCTSRSSSCTGPKQCYISPDGDVTTAPDGDYDAFLFYPPAPPPAPVNAPPKTLYQEGWCSNWNHAYTIVGGDQSYFTDHTAHAALWERNMDSCFYLCATKPLCQQAVFENALGQWGPQCWLGINNMTAAPNPTRSACSSIAGCADTCYSKQGFDMCSCTGNGNEIMCTVSGKRHCATGVSCPRTGIQYPAGDWSMCG